MTLEEQRSVPCKCGAAIGAPCITNTGRKASATHKPRIQAAKAARVRADWTTIDGTTDQPAEQEAEPKPPQAAEVAACATSDQSATPDSITSNTALMAHLEGFYGDLEESKPEEYQAPRFYGQTETPKPHNKPTRQAIRARKRARRRERHRLLRGDMASCVRSLTRLPRHIAEKATGAAAEKATGAASCARSLARLPRHIAERAVGSAIGGAVALALTGLHAVVSAMEVA